jgi:NADH-quinone oxidoreductase subunit A
LLVGVNWVLINFRTNNRKNSPYECGFEPVGSPVSEFTPNFTAVALIFLIYDVEILLTFPWAYSAAGHTAFSLVAFFFFIILMLLGLAFEVLDDSFNVV